MKKLISFLLFLLCAISLTAQTDRQQVLKILDDQLVAWNKGDLDSFMKGYWKHDSLMFVGKSGVTYGYDNTLRNYRKNYGDSLKMGKLSFEILHVNELSPDFYFVVGKWFLKRSIGDLSGHYTLVFRKIAGKWVIITDHSS